MTTLQVRYERYGEVVASLERVRSRWWLAVTGRGVAVFVALAAGSALSVTVIAGFIPVPGWVRGVMLYGTGMIWAVGLVWFVLWPMFRETGAEEVARRVEEALPNLENRLINAVQLARDPQVPSPALVNEVIRETARALEHEPVERAVDADRRGALRWTALAVGLLVLLGLYALGWPTRFRGAVGRIWRYNQYVPFVGSVRLVEVKPGNCSVVVGEAITVQVRIDNPAGRTYRAWLYTRPEGAAVEEALPMQPTAPDRFTRTVADIRLPFTYRVKVGDTESPLYRVRVSARPVISAIELLYHYPSYTGLEPRRAEGGDISAVRYSTVDITVRVNKPVREGALMFEGGRRKPLAVSSDGRSLTTRLIIERSQSYRITVTDVDGYSNEDPATYRIRAMDDQPPAVVIRRPGRDVEVSPGDGVTVVIDARDDFGLSEVRLWMQPGGVGTPQLVRRWTDLGPGREARVTFDWSFPAGKYARGSSLVYYAEVVDNRNLVYGSERLAPQATRSGKYVIKFIDRKAVLAERMGVLERVRARLEEVLRLQREARKRAGELKPLAVRERRGGALGLRDAQADIRARTLDIAGECPSGEVVFARLRAALISLGNNEMARAVRLAGEVARAAQSPLAESALEGLIGTQDRIIDILQRLLGILPELRERMLAEAERPEGADLPAEAEGELRDLLEKLKKFVEEQRKVIDATEDLAKKPVDDFTEEDQAKLETLKALEDKWAKFLKEAFTDLSKLPPQDFGDATMLKELVEIQSDVEMAKDALAKKAVELAVPLEQAGLERAEELTTHLEKWLPDTPDRDQWKMEEPLAGIDQPQAPMAQLPKELEDIVGELMEQEEDLFDDIEDVTSQWADSLDKGAGWDAMDGPISNMSAQGVTGNRLPNTSEIAGRSGEGRTGKSAGEFVEEEATGKGGRRTPTRLTPDPYMQGEVKDTSKEPPGGSTGGGKLSGAAPEGLEGPVPPQLSRRMERLAGRQAELRNKAERIHLQFKVMNYASSKLEEVIRQMRGVERDLRHYRYASALRRKRVLLEGLKTTKMYLAGEIAINRDRTANLPDRLQSEIRDAIEGEVPAGYERLLSKYYEALSRASRSR